MYKYFNSLKYFYFYRNFRAIAVESQLGFRPIKINY